MNVPLATVDSVVGVLVVGLEVGVRVGGLEVGLPIVGLEVGLGVIGLFVLGFGVGLSAVGLLVVGDVRMRVGFNIVGLRVVGLAVGIDVGFDVNDLGGEVAGCDDGVKGLLKKFDTSDATSLICLALLLLASPIGFPLYKAKVLENLWTRVQLPTPVYPVHWPTAQL